VPAVSEALDLPLSTLVASERESRHRLRIGERAGAAKSRLAKNFARGLMLHENRADIGTKFINVGLRSPTRFGLLSPTELHD
jgi:hypothetical protein